MRRCWLPAQVPIRCTPVENWDLPSSLRPFEAAFTIDFEADVAQLVEQSIRNRQVIGSSPIVGSILPIGAVHWRRNPHSTGAADKAVNLVGCKSPHHQLPGRVVSISDACGGNEACSART